MRWIDRRCVRQSCRFCDSCLCVFSSISGSLCIGHTLQQSVQQSYSAVLFSTTQQVNTIGKRLLLSYTISYFRILEILYVCTNLHSWNHHVPWIFSSETILIITWRKWKLLVRLLSIMRICQILVITSKSSSSTKQLKEKYYIKNTTIGVLTSPKQPFYYACL